MNNTTLWIITIIFTLASAYFQRRTGPTKPVKGSIEIDGTHVKYKLIRSEVSGEEAAVKIFTGNSNIIGSISYKRFKSYDDWTTQTMHYSDGYLTAFLPTQPPAGKVMYQVKLSDNNNDYTLTNEPIIIRYKDDVPAWSLIPHILFMFIAMLYSNRAGLQAILHKDNFLRLSIISFISLVLGGLIFGPIVQKYAFGAYWTGFPFGHDLTDNKTAVAVFFWGIALYKTMRQSSGARWWVLAAAVVLMLTYMIPHSLMGSELDFTAEGM